MDLLAHFNFRAMPFTREVLVSELFAHPQRDDITDAILRIIDQRMSGALIAPAGFGKTTLLRTVRDRLPEVRYDVRYVKVTSLSKRDMCREISAALGLRSAGTYPSLVRAMQEAVSHRVADDGVRTVLILDEAHDMRPDVLSMLRVLTNFDMDSRLVLSILLVGQPPLAKMLRRADLEDLTQRMMKRRKDKRSAEASPMAPSVGPAAASRRRSSQQGKIVIVDDPTAAAPQQGGGKCGC